MNDRLFIALLVGLAAAVVAWFVRRGLDKVVRPRPLADDHSSSEGN